MPSPSNGSYFSTNDTFAYQPVTATTVLFSFMIIIGAPGNILLLLAIGRRQPSRAPYFYMLFSIALADLGMAMIAAPQRIIENYTGWPFGSFMCNFLVSIQELFVSVSVVTHTTIALERYRTIQQPFNKRFNQKTSKFLVAFIWLGCYVSAALPQAVILELYKGPDGRVYCIPEFPSHEFRRVYEVYLVVLFITVPLFIQSWCYVNVFIVVYRELKRASEGNANRKDILKRIKQKIHVVKVLVCLVAVFQCCSIPRGVLMLIREFEDDVAMATNQVFLYADAVCLFAYYVKHTVNPIILWSTSKEFRLC